MQFELVKKMLLDIMQMATTGYDMARLRDEEAVRRQIEALKKRIAELAVATHG